MPNSSGKRKRSGSRSGDVSKVYEMLQRLENRLISLEKKRRHYRDKTSDSDVSSSSVYQSESETEYFRPSKRRRVENSVSYHSADERREVQSTPPPRPPSAQLQRPSAERDHEVIDRLEEEVKIIEPMPVVNKRNVTIHTNNETRNLQKEILSILGEEGAIKDTFTKPIHADVASRWESILTKGLDEETKSALIIKYLPPENCQSINPPTINPEVKVAISESIIRRDERLSHNQQQIASSLSAVGLALTMMLEDQEGKIRNKEYIQLLSDAGRLLSNVHFSESRSRRELIALNLNKELKDTLVNTPISGLLFGKDLDERIKTAKELEKSGQQLKLKKRPSRSSTVQSNPGNFRSLFPQRSAGVRRNGPALHQTPIKKSHHTSTYKRTLLKRGQTYHSQNSQYDRRRPRRS